MKLLITCEHAENTIPKNYQSLFNNKTRLLQSHQGIDIGAISLYKTLVKQFDCHHFAGKYSRLLVDLNRSLHHPNLFSNITKQLTNQQKKELLDKYYHPYRNSISHFIEKTTQEKQTVLHISVHSFTPVLNGHQRDCDIGLLYDPARHLEKRFCQQWKHALHKKIKTRVNYPYKGKSDGLTSSLRKKYGAQNYIGIELETNQALYKNSTCLLFNTIIETLKHCLKEVD